jgi:hypothetical protein
MKNTFSRSWCCTLAAVAIPLAALAASPSIKPTNKGPALAMGLFEGMESGEIEVKVIPKDSTEGTITVKNKAGKPLTIKLPDAFAGVPVLAQGLLGDPAAGGGGGGGGANQGFGAGGAGMMGGMGGMGGQAGGFFNVAPEKIAKIKIAMVCLDHGKKDPSPRVPYKLIPIESYAKDPAVVEVIKMLAKGEIDQHSAQAAAWHLQNGLSWDALAKKIGVKHLNGSVEPYFTVAHLQRALAATRVAEERAEKASQQKSPATSIGEELAQQK